MFVMSLTLILKKRNLNKNTITLYHSFYIMTTSFHSILWMFLLSLVLKMETNARVLECFVDKRLQFLHFQENTKNFKKKLQNNLQKC
ncbi:hypothetical protein KUTeg_023406 [Tegillarca granosa]|uniref:Uncharacterized protein n=1 Tax=Tegillarca granosa TaxID=220873 RepID=A0ABQ9E1J5_TEGGR|nr:hypothetical protein KUTeg_023406 [Tegillarca granosa]